MKKIINDPQNFVDESLEGIVLAHPRDLRLVGRGGRGVVRADAPVAGKVAIVTGGGSGHLPVWLGYVGRGLLDGAAIGNVFSSPAADQIADLTRAVDGGAGVLYLYGNYGGDIYNFDIARDLVLADGIAVQTVLAFDDVASATVDRRETRRGVAGMIYAFRIAGAAAERGDGLDAVAAVARKAGERTRTMGVGLSPTILPAAGEPSFDLPDGEMEVGIGIHGEPGIHRGPLDSADEIADRLLDAILADLPEATSGSTVSVLVNGMGATPLEELYLLYRRVAHRLGDKGIRIHVPLVGNYVTSLEMAGASLSLLLLDDELRELLDRPAVTPFVRFGEETWGFWEGSGADIAEDADAGGDAVGGAGGVVGPGADAGAPAGPASPLGELLLDLLAKLPTHEGELRDLDAALGDGDLGITVAAGAHAARGAVAAEPGAADADLLRSVGTGFATANPSTFGALIGGGIIAAASRLGSLGLGDRAAVLAWSRDVVAEIVRRGGAEVGDKTVVDAILPALEVLEAQQSAPIDEVLAAMHEAASAAVARLAGASSGRGRAAWLGDRSRGLEDAGMVAFARFVGDLREAFAARR